MPCSVYFLLALLRVVRERVAVPALLRVLLGFRDAVGRRLRDAAGFDLRAAVARVDRAVRDFVLEAARERVVRLELLRVVLLLVALVRVPLLFVLLRLLVPPLLFELLRLLVVSALLARELRAALVRDRVVVFDFERVGLRLLALAGDLLRLLVRLDELLRVVDELRRAELRVGILLSPMFRT